MRRVLVMGPPGSGKSTLARRLGQHYGLPVFHLDQAFHRPGWIPAPEEEFRAEVERIAALPAWIIDGNYIGSAASRIAAADTLIYLDAPRWLTMPRIVWRIASTYGRVRVDSAPGCPEQLDWEFLRFAWRWNRKSRASRLVLVSRFSERTIVLRGWQGQRAFEKKTFSDTG